jgi:hypothetical protein
MLIRNVRKFLNYTAEILVTLTFVSYDYYNFNLSVFSL